MIPEVSRYKGILDNSCLNGVNWQFVGATATHTEAYGLPEPISAPTTMMIFPSDQDGYTTPI